MRYLLVVVALLSPTAVLAETHRLRPTTGHATFAVRPPILTIKPGDIVESESLWGEWYEKAGGKWPGEVGPIAIEGAEPGDTLVVGANYAATAKTSFYANAAYRRGSNDGSSVSDHFRTFAVGVNYVPARAWQLGCNLAHEGRSSGAYSYDANVIGCNVQFMLR